MCSISIGPSLIQPFQIMLNSPNSSEWKKVALAHNSFEEMAFYVDSAHCLSIHDDTPSLQLRLKSVQLNNHFRCVSHGRIDPGSHKMISIGRNAIEFLSHMVQHVHHTRIV